jgi:hydroxymethylglutaryl-CoA lyase
MRVSIYEVGPRDGLQSLPNFVPTDLKQEFIASLYGAGLKDIEETSMAHPKLVPQMADAEQVFHQGGVLVMNPKGYERAIAMGAKKINVVFSPCETFNLKNMKRTRSEIVLMYKTLLKIPKKDVRVYISMAFGSPYSGTFNEKEIRNCVKDAKMLGNTVVFADTIGCGTPKQVRLFAKIAKEERIKSALHLHHKGNEDEAFELIKSGLFAGIKQFDSSIGGLGGCPFTENSGANISTEKLVKHFSAWGFSCGVEPKNLVTALNIAHKIKELQSKSL